MVGCSAGKIQNNNSFFFTRHIISVYAMLSTSMSNLLANCPQEIMLPPYPLSLDFQLRVWDQSLSFNFGHPTHPVSGLRNEKNFLSSFIFNGFFKTSVRLPHLRTSFVEGSRIISEVTFYVLIAWELPELHIDLSKVVYKVTRRTVDHNY